MRVSHAGLALFLTAGRARALRFERGDVVARVMRCEAAPGLEPGDLSLQTSAVPTHSPPYQQAADRTHVESEATASHRGNSSVKRRARSMRQKKQEPANRLPSVLAWTSRRGLQVPPTYTRASRSASPLCHQQCHHHRTHGEFEDAGRDPGAAPPTCSRSTSGRFPRSPPSGSPLNFAPVRAQIVRTHPFRHEKGAPRRAPKSLIAFESGRQDLNLRPLAPHASALPDCATPRCLRARGLTGERGF